MIPERACSAMAGRRGSRTFRAAAPPPSPCWACRTNCGPWAQGGRATVRPLTRTPYIHGPDGFGSGQPDGMVVGYADGHAGFLSKDIDPHVMEQLASVRGSKDVDMALIEPKPPETVVGPKPVPGPRPPAVPDVKPPVIVEVKPPESPSPKLQALLDLPIANILLPNLPLADAVQTVSADGQLCRSASIPTPWRNWAYRSTIRSRSRSPRRRSARRWKRSPRSGRWR